MFGLLKKSKKYHIYLYKGTFIQSQITYIKGEIDMVTTQTNEGVNLSLTQEQFNTMVAYFAKGRSFEADEYALENGLSILGFNEQTELFAQLVNMTKGDTVK